jgi:tRNA A-37 threonylcarbamoyl transferase component Bud32
MKIFRKDITDRTEEQIRNEVELQNIAYKQLNCTPEIIGTDYKTYIEMEDLEEMCIADMYGEDINSVPNSIREQIYKILIDLYLECDIEYTDITPYNFIEKNSTVYIIDFGDAKLVKKNWFLKEVFVHKKITEWNPDFK